MASHVTIYSTTKISSFIQITASMVTVLVSNGEDWEFSSGSGKPNTIKLRKTLINI